MGLGIALWSKLPVERPKVRTLVSADRPSIKATVCLPGGDRINLIGVHPVPPGLEKRRGHGRHDSRVRDAELVLVGREVASAPDEPWLVLGDLNDVAWSKTTRLFKRVSGLKAPRVGRALCNTYNAHRPLLRYPLDHIFASEGFAIARFTRVRTPGSDHFAVLADMALADPRGVDPEPSRGDRQRAREMTEEGFEDAAEDELAADRAAAPTRRRCVTAGSRAALSAGAARAAG